MSFAYLEHIRRACHRVINDVSLKEKIRELADEILQEARARGEVIQLGDTIICHGGGDEIIIQQKLILPDSMICGHVKLILNELEKRLRKMEHVAYVIVSLQT